jgi:hypothetical protein
MVGFAGFRFVCTRSMCSDSVTEITNGGQTMVGLSVNRRPTNLLARLDAAKLEVARLQELKCSDAAFPIAAIRKTG